MEISEERYNELLKDSLMIRALDNAGVDNWEWYGEAIDIFYELCKENNIEV